MVWPVPRVGAFALTVRYLNEGEQPSVDDQGTVIGSFVSVDWIVAGTFAAQFGTRLAAGLTLKFLQLGSNCTGSCDLPPFPPRTAAIDFGVRYFLTKDSLIAIGASGLNLGLPLQVNDSPQADQLPSRAVIGVAVSPRFPQMPKEVHVHAEVDMIKAISSGGPGFSIRWRDRLDGSVRSARGLSAHMGPRAPDQRSALASRRASCTSTSRRCSPNSGRAAKPTFLSLRYVF